MRVATRALSTGYEPAGAIANGGALAASLRAAASMVLVFLMVFGITMPAGAATSTYWSGYTFRNQTKSSSTHAMDGGSVSIILGSPFFTIRATAVGISSFSSTPSFFAYTHIRTTTYVYCQWRMDFPDIVPPPTGTKYNMTCKYTC